MIIVFSCFSLLVELINACAKGGGTDNLAEPKKLFTFAPMKKIFLTAILLLAGWGLQAQSYKLVFADDIPAAAVEVLQQRFTQMLSAGGLSVADEGAPLEVSAKITSLEQTGGSLGQVALEIELLASSGKVAETFNIKGVGDSEADAWLRAVKQLLPRSKTASAFIEKLK